MDQNQVVLVGEAVAGQSAKSGKVRNQLEEAIKQSNTSLFDIAELLHVIKKNGYYEGYTTFSEYVKSLSLKSTKAQYLERIADVMERVGITRSQYEKVTISRLREISTLKEKIDDTWVNPETNEEIPIKDFIVGFVAKGNDMDLEEMKNHIKTLKGLVGTEAMSWLHLYIKQSVLDNTARPALELAKKQIGSQGKDDEGISKDASDGQAAEVIFVAFLNDPANDALAGE